MKVSDVFDWRVFAGAFCVGIIIVYLTAPPRKIIYRFPSPENVGVFTYTAEDGTCYKYGAERVKCVDYPEGQVREQPFQSRNVEELTKKEM